MDWESNDRHSGATVGEAALWLLLAAIIVLVLADWDSAMAVLLR